MNEVRISKRWADYYSELSPYELAAFQLAFLLHEVITTALGAELLANVYVGLFVVKIDNKHQEHERDQWIRKAMATSLKRAI
jgi:hypothetical protein